MILSKSAPTYEEDRVIDHSSPTDKYHCDLGSCENDTKTDFQNESITKSSILTNQQQFISRIAPTSFIIVKIQTFIQHCHTRDKSMDSDVVYIGRGSGSKK